MYEDESLKCLTENFCSISVVISFKMCGGEPLMFLLISEQLTCNKSFELKMEKRKEKENIGKFDIDKTWLGRKLNLN